MKRHVRLKVLASIVFGLCVVYFFPILSCEKADSACRIDSVGPLILTGAIRIEWVLIYVAAAAGMFILLTVAHMLADWFRLKRMIKKEKDENPNVPS